jgi:hypothetical protein
VLLREALQAVGVKAQIVEQKVETQAQAEALRFPGSPTIRINGEDIDPVGAAVARSALTCRTYGWADGRLQPLPEKRRIIAALRRASESGHGS